MSANILIVGCGAIGGLFAAALSSVAKVTAFDINADHVSAINTQGLRIIGKNQRTVHIAATDDAASLRSCSLSNQNRLRLPWSNCVPHSLPIQRLSRCKMAWATRKR